MYEGLFEQRAMLVFVVNVDQPRLNRTRVAQYVLLVNNVV